MPGLEVSVFFVQKLHMRDAISLSASNGKFLIMSVVTPVSPGASLIFIPCIASKNSLSGGGSL